MVENVFSRYMHLHNHFEDEQIKALWVKRGTAGVHAQYTNNGVYTDYDSIMAYHTGRPSPKGKLILHYTTTPSIEVAEDGETAKGFWLMAGVESGTTELEHVGKMPEFLYEPERANVDGGKKRVWAHWVWCQYALDFLRQDGEWKIWHFRCLEVARAPFSENWVTFAAKNQIAFDKVCSPSDRLCMRAPCQTDLYPGPGILWRRWQTGVHANSRCTSCEGASPLS